VPDLDLDTPHDQTCSICGNRYEAPGSKDLPRQRRPLRRLLLRERRRSRTHQSDNSPRQVETAPRLKMARPRCEPGPFSSRAAGAQFDRHRQSRPKLQIGSNPVAFPPRFSQKQR
jgi:hypothetical protein